MTYQKINLDLDDDIFEELTAIAHKRNITFNDLVIEILNKQITKIENKNYIVRIDKNGVIPIPQHILDQLKWDENTFLSIYIENNNIIIKEKTDWTIEDLQVCTEQILERIKKTGKPHHLIHNGRIVVIHPAATTPNGDELYCHECGGTILRFNSRYANGTEYTCVLCGTKIMDRSSIS